MSDLDEGKFDWRNALARFYDLCRELERARADLEVERATSAKWRRRAGRAEEAWATYAARARAESQVGDVDPERLGNVTVRFAQHQEEAVSVPPGRGTAQFVYGLLDLLLRDSRPIYFEVERKADGELRAVESKGRDVA